MCIVFTWRCKFYIPVVLGKWQSRAMRTMPTITQHIIVLVTYWLVSCEATSERFAYDSRYARNDRDGQAPDVSPDVDTFTSNELPENMRYMASVGNGHLATNIYSDTVYMNGFYSGELGGSHRARIPSYHSSNLTTTEGATSQNYKLDTTRAVFEQVFITPSAEVTYRVYAHHFYNRLLVTEVKVERLAPGSAINVDRASLSGDEDSVFDLILNPKEDHTSQIPACAAMVDVTCSKRTGTIDTPETSTSGLTPVYIYWNEMPPTFTLPAGEDSNTWTYVLSVDVDDVAAVQNFNRGMEHVLDQTTDVLLDMHVDSWSNVWASGSIELEGDASILPLQKVIRGSLYYLYSFLPSHNVYSTRNQFYGLSPGGLANGEWGRDYYGHVFWDMETWMYPSILLFRPDLAKEMLSYRINGMDPAFERAASGGYEGTRFPWESSYTGVEVTPDICVPCRENQQHITGCIAFAARQYVSTTRDIEWLTTTQGPGDYTGFDFIQNMARFFYTRPTYNANKDKYEINGVMPPDEHQQSINNSVYTNVVASLSVHFARYASCLAGRDELQDVPEAWIDVVQSLVFPYDQERRYHEEYEGYEQDVQNNNTHESFVKQADVVLLGYPLLWDMPDDVRRNDLLEYENVTSPGGPAMTWGMFATGWLDTGDDVKASALFDRSYQLYYREPYKVWTEAQMGAGAINFATGMGGFLQALISGYGGLRLRVEELQFRTPKLPTGVTKLSLNNLHYLGSELDIDIDISDVTLTVVVEGSMPLQVNLEDGTGLDLLMGVPRTFSLQPFSVNTTVSTGCALPLDNIDVDYTPLWRGMM